MIHSAIEWLGRMDTALFERVNRAWSCAPLDAVLPALTDLHKNRVFVFFVLPAGLLAWVWAQRARAARVIVATALVVGATDVFAYRLIKHFIHRPRPQWAGVSVILRRPPQMSPSFPSNHAANVFAAATFLGSVYPALRVPLFTAAAVVGYSRVYVGVHYPSDVAAGALLGCLIGWLGSRTFRKYEDRTPG